MSRSATAIASVLLFSLVGSMSFGQTDDSPVGSVVAWLKSYDNTPALPDGWVECNGQVLDDSDSPFNGQTIPDLNGATGTRRFLRGSGVSGNLGGSEAHTHTLSWGYNNLENGGVNTIDSPVTNATSTLPSYYEVVWIMKVKSAPAVVPAVSEWGLIVMGLLIVSAGTIVFITRRPLRTV